MRNISDSIYTAESSSSVLGTRQAHFIRRHLRRTVPVAASIVLCLCSLLSRAPLRAQGTLPQGPEYRYGVKVEMVNLFATVQDAAGKLVTNLRRDDFIVYDNGLPQFISRFSREYIPVSVIILLDNSSSMLAGKKLTNAKKALSQFLERLRPGDEAMLITFRTRPKVVQDFTQHIERLRKELRRLDGNGSTALYDAILTALEEARKAHNQRRTLLLITDGLNTYGRAQIEETIQRLRSEGTELFAIGLESDLPEDLQDRAITRFVLDRLTQSAGGESFTLSESKRLGRICDTISDRIHNQYTFGYYPPPSAGEGWRSISIVTRSAGLKITPSKKGYYAAGRPSVPSR